MDFLLLLLLLSVCLLSCSGTTSVSAVVTVREGSEAVLPCFIRPEQDITQDQFEWKKDGQKVFFYERGSHYNNGLPGQDEQFKGRVSHFPQQLQSGDASIKIRDTKPSDSGTYTCDFSPDEPNRQLFNIELDVVAVVRVTEESEAVLPCLIRPERDITQHLFDWKKDEKQEVFMYNKGQHYNNGLTGQDEQFKGRVSHFPEQLQSGNASIVIRDTKWSDSGNYTCDFALLQPKGQKYNIELVVACGTLRDRSEEKGKAACRQPSVTILKATNHWAILQCEVQGFKVSSKPTVQWRDSAGNNLTAEETLVPKTGGNNDIVLKTKVTETDNYQCVVIQEEICHQFFKEIFVNIADSSAGLAADVVVTFVVTLVGLLAKGCITQN